MKIAQVKFNANALKEKMFKNLVETQTQLLIEYAEEKVRVIGDDIQRYNSKHHFDRTGNLLNSICWGVAYSGKLKASGFYREAQHKSYKVNSYITESESFLHEYFGEEKYAYPVNGRALAESYIKQKGRASALGYWRVWFAILAPYWGYWEKGFDMKSGFGEKRTSKRVQFSVMAEFYDKVSNELSPAKVKLDVFVPEYSPKQREARYKRFISADEKFKPIY